MSGVWLAVFKQMEQVGSCVTSGFKTSLAGVIGCLETFLAFFAVDDDVFSLESLDAVRFMGVGDGGGLVEIEGSAFLMSSDDIAYRSAHQVTHSVCGRIFFGLPQLLAPAHLRNIFSLHLVKNVSWAQSNFCPRV